ncbi:NIPA-like protein 2 [Rissa tridactyla]|uniref:NIPA-like protein 2 n=1 Tax=Rissa tridactyla TaxID=75485 RepID=UPI0023BABA90|nr:NIPA-like protein 2 [Rissa tridactyla]
MGILPVLEWASWNVSFGGPDTGSGPLSGPWYSTHKTQLLGVLLAAASNFLISVSLNIQKCSHLRLACRKEPKPYYTSKLWWCGITLLGLGEVGNFIAYGFAPIALVAPLGCVSVIGSAFISVLFLKKTMRAADILGGTLTVTGTYLLVTFAPNVPQELTARRVQNYLVSWPFLVYLILEIITFCILLYFYKQKAVKHIVVLLMMVALLASLTVIAVKAVASMITLSAKGKMQLTYPVFYIMIVLMATSCAFQVKFLNQAMHLYEATAVVPINFVFFTTSAIISGVIFYQEFQSAALLSVFMFLFGCLLSFLGVFVIARNKREEHLQIPFIDCGLIPGKKLTGKIQPDSRSSRYGTLNNEDDSVKSQS